MKFQSVARHAFGLAASLFCATAICAAAGGAQTPGEREISLDSLLNTRISTASKYLQTSAEAAASVTILSGDEIRHLGYTNLQEVLESVPGMYVSNDRNYPYLGTRGFGRPSDYNNRILVLIDGHTLNDQVWGGAPVGSDLPVNLDVVERIEVVRGPGSALYGTSAMFAVINVVTKGGKQIGGATASARIGSGNDRQLAATVGRGLGRNSALTVAVLGNKSDGQTLRYPEFSSADNARGTVRQLDWEQRAGLQASLITGRVTSRFGAHSRSKGVPTASFASIFGDRRTQTVDEAVWGEIGMQTSIGRNYQLSARAYGDRNTYGGKFAYSKGATYDDQSRSTSLGGEAIVTWDVASRNRLTVGSELRRMLVAAYETRDEAGTVFYANAPFTVASLFAQNELEISARVKLVGGIRFDRKLHRWHALAPRFALIAVPDASTTLKWLYGEAYRAPSVSESDVTTDFYVENRSLRPERIATTELVLERRIKSAFLLGASAYQYSMRNLIEQVENDTVVGVRFANRMPVRGRGAEVTLSLQPAGSPISLRAWYAVQKTRDDSTRMPLSNSPSHTMNGSFIARGAYGTIAALSWRHESGRLMLNGVSTASFTRADLSLGVGPAGSGRWLNGFDVAFRTSNLFDARYAVPGGLEHVQQSIEQNGRMFSLRVRRVF
jgi:outer membrane receptor protein involved in Fe transport